MLFFRTKVRAVFIDGFAKNSQDNINDDDLERFRTLAAEFLRYDAKQINRLVKTGAWIEVECDGN